MNNNNNFNESAGQPEHKKITATRILLLVVCLAVVGVAGITLQTRRSKNQPTVEQPSGRRFAGKAENSVPFVPATRQSKDAQYLSKSQINADGTITGAKIVMDEGIQRTVREIMRDQASAPRRPERVMPEHEIERGVKAERPGAPATSQWPVPKAGDQPQVQPQAPQTTGLSFDGATLSDTGAFPPDSMGAVGPTQYFTFVNGRLRTFSKTGTADGVINADPDVFFASVMTPVTPPVVLNFTSDPNVRYDRFTSRWFLTIIDVPCTNATCTTTAANRVLIAVSDAASNGTISAGTVWTFFQFVGDPGTNFLDYPSLGVDVNALYIGGNMFSSAGAFVGCNGYVVQKSSILGGGPGVATAFANIAAGAGAGPESPRGVDNFDSTATEGYIVGPDNASFSTITFRRVSNPGSATPTISANIFVTVPTTTSPNTVEHLGNTGGANGNLDTIDDRFFQAMIRNGRLWSAHNFRVSSAGVASTVAAARNGVRWYEFQGLTSTPTLVQSGTVFDNAATRAAARQYTIPSVTVSGQGHAVLGFTMAGSPVGATPAYVGRLASDTLGTMAGPPTIAAVAFGTTTANYNPASDPGGASGRRWGDYSHTSLDPKDDMTIWTIQEYNQASNSYAVRVGKLLAPPPATLSTLAPSSVSAGQASVNVTITGTSTAGSGFYDPGANLPAPALPFTHIAAAVTGGVTVNSVTYTDPTHITLNLSTVGASAGAQNVTVTNPDGQSTVGNGILTVTGGNTAPSITPVAVNRQQGSPSSNSTIATVSDTETAAGSLTVNVNGSASATVNNITVSNLVNNSGTITANVVAACNATLGTTNFTINVSDGSLTTPGTLMVTVSANTAPTLTYNNQAVLFGNALTVNPASGPSDNGSVASIVLQSVTPSTAPGTITVNNTTGAVSVPNNVPIGGYTVTIRATDNCNAPTDAPFTLTVNNNLPTITAGGPLARQQGSAGTVSTVATVGDTETAAGSLTVTATTVPAGLTVTGITNTSGTITANVAAACNAALGTNTVVLTVTDGNGGTATANLTVNVTANTAPVLTYSAQAVAAGGALNISPATGPSDNGAVSTITVQSQGAYTGTISVNNSTGVVSLSNAKPGGVHTITIRATDNCNTTTDATFTLTVNCPTISLSPASLPNGTVGIGYNQTITASGGTAPYSFSISAGVLPTGLTLSSAGVLSGTPSVANPFNFTVLATDANGCTGTLAYAVTINPANILPTINAVAVSRQQGSPVSNSTIANVNDPDQALNTLAVTVNSGASATVNGVTVNGLSVNAAGVVTANVMAACGATNASFTLTVTDAASATATATLTVTVTANTAPTLSYANQALAAGSALNISPASGPSDNGSVSTITVLNQGTYTGTISVNNGTGVVSLSNAAPVGVHTITIRATDNCGATTDAPFTLTVNNNLPTITAAAPLARQQGGAGIVSTVATVSDTETPAGSLTVTATTVPAGLTVTGITNTSGTITANVAASCAATLGANTVVLTVTDGNGGTATANLTVNVTANT
ncbi:MAG: hypothetical protein HYR56_18140, partial [Acidobacteria bacterium]|nr:hypothetical protein [Acidobacteriota bacterium]